MQKLWNSVQRPNLHTTGAGEETWAKSTENIFSKIIKEILPDLRKEIPIEVQEV